MLASIHIHVQRAKIATPAANSLKLCILIAFGFFRTPLRGGGGLSPESLHDGDRQANHFRVKELHSLLNGADV